MNNHNSNSETGGDFSADWEVLHTFKYNNEEHAGHSTPSITNQNGVRQQDTFNTSEASQYAYFDVNGNAVPPVRILSTVPYQSGLIRYGVFNAFENGHFLGSTKVPQRNDTLQRNLGDALQGNQYIHGGTLPAIGSLSSSPYSAQQETWLNNPSYPYPPLPVFDPTIEMNHQQLGYRYLSQAGYGQGPYLFFHDELGTPLQYTSHSKALQLTAPEDSPTQEQSSSLGDQNSRSQERKHRVEDDNQNSDNVASGLSPDANGTSEDGARKFAVVSVDERCKVRKDAEIKKIDGELHIKLQTPSNSWARAVKFNDIHNIDRTTPTPGQEGWTSKRGGGRSQILYEYRPVGCYAYRPQGSRTSKPAKCFPPLTHCDGRVLLNVAGQPLRKLAHMPLTVAIDVGGWYVAAVRRLNPEVGLVDFIDRMPVKRSGATLRNRPATGTLNHRESRARQVMRCITWPVQSKLRYCDEMVDQEMALLGIPTNSTRHLRDLTKSQELCQNIVMDGDKHGRAGTNGRSQGTILELHKDGLKTLLRNGFAMDSREVQIVRTRLDQQVTKIGVTIDNSDVANIDVKPELAADE